jgi:hypothetical protein
MGAVASPSVDSVVRHRFSRPKTAAVADAPTGTEPVARSRPITIRGLHTTIHHAGLLHYFSSAAIITIGIVYYHLFIQDLSVLSCCLYFIFL